MTFGWVRQYPYLLAALCALAVATGVALPFLATDEREVGAGSTMTVQAASRDSVIISSPVALNANLGLHLERGTISLARSVGFRLPSLESPEKQLASGQANLVVRDAYITLDQSAATHAAASSEDQGQAEINPFLIALKSLNLGTLRFENTKLAIKRAGGVKLLENVDAEVISRGRKGLLAHGTFTLSGVEITFDTKLGVPTPAAPSSAVPLRLHLDSAMLSAELDGQLKLTTPLQVTSRKAQLNVSHLRKAARWLGVDWNDGAGFNSFAASGPFEWSGDGLSFEQAAFDIDGNAARGGLSLRFVKERPSIEGTLAFETFELSPYLGEAMPQSGTFPLAATWTPFLPSWGNSTSSIIQEIDADVRLSASHAHYAGTRVGSGAAAITIHNGLLLAHLTEIEPVDGGDGIANVSIDMHGTEPSYAINGRFSECDLASGSGLVFGLSLLKGTGNVTFSLAAKGASPDDVLKSIAGKTDIDMLEGGGIALDAGALRRSITASPQNGWGSVVDKIMPVDALTARFSAKSGLVSIEKLAAQTPDLAISAVGSVSVSNRTLDVTLALSDRGEKSLMPDKSSLSAPSLIQLRGSWFSPYIRAATEPGKSADAAIPESVLP